MLLIIIFKILGSVFNLIWVIIGPQMTSTYRSCDEVDKGSKGVSFCVQQLSISCRSIQYRQSHNVLNDSIVLFDNPSPYFCSLGSFI